VERFSAFLDLWPLRFWTSFDLLAVGVLLRDVGHGERETYTAERIYLFLHRTSNTVITYLFRDIRGKKGLLDCE